MTTTLKPAQQIQQFRDELAQVKECESQIAVNLMETLG